MGDSYLLSRTPPIIWVFTTAVRLVSSVQRVLPTRFELRIAIFSMTSRDVQGHGYWHFSSINNFSACCAKLSCGLLNDYSTKNLFIFNAIAAQYLVPKGFSILCWGHIRRWSKAEDLGVHFGDTIFSGIHLQEIVDTFSITGHCSLPFPSTPVWR